MGRTTVYNQNLFTPEEWEKVSKENKDLIDEFLIYKKASNKSPQTIDQYFQMLRIFFIWNLKENNNTFFMDIKKKTMIKFIYHMSENLKYSSNRIATVKSTLSSLGNYIEGVLSDEYPLYRNQMRNLETPPKQAVREKTILTEEMVEKTLDSLIDKGLYQVACYLAAGAASGARKAEVLQFKIDSFVDDNIMYGCMWKTNPVRSKGRGKEGKVIQKLVFINQFKKYLDLWLLERAKLGITSEYLFVTDKGEKAEISNANNWGQTISRHMKNDFYYHSLRHHFVTYLKTQQLPDDVIISIVGWEKSSGNAMVAIYNDIKIEDTLHNYFDENGIKKID